MFGGEFNAAYFLIGAKVGIGMMNNYSAKSNVTTLDKLINFALVCVQIAYPYIYNQLTEEPDFKAWNERIASKLKLRPLTELERENLDSTEEFDELVAIGKKSVFL